MLGNVGEIKLSVENDIEVFFIWVEGGNIGVNVEISMGSIFKIKDFFLS